MLKSNNNYSTNTHVGEEARRQQQQQEEEQQPH